MKTTIKRISITLDESEANSIRNTLLKGLGGDYLFNPSRHEDRGSVDLLNLLSGIFHSSVPNIHRPK